MNCKYCQSSNVIKYGSFRGIQRYWCKDCKRKFAGNEALPKMKTPSKQIEDAMSMYYGGMPLNSIQRHLYQEYNNYLSESGIYNWVIRFSKEATIRANSFKPVVGDTWVADETVIKVGHKNVWFLDIIDVKSRYLLASHISRGRTIGDTKILVKQASEVAGKAPKVIITDYLQSYTDGIEQAFGADTIHIKDKPFASKTFNNIIERFHGTLKDRTNVMRGFGNMRTARILTNGWLIHYNFFKEHETLGNIPPAQKMGIEVPFKNWAEVVKETVIPYKPTRIIPNISPSTPTPSSIYSSKQTQRRTRKRKVRISSPTISSIRK